MKRDSIGRKMTRTLEAITVLAWAVCLGLNLAIYGVWLGTEEISAGFLYGITFGPLFGFLAGAVYLPFYLIKRIPFFQALLAGLLAFGVSAVVMTAYSLLIMRHPLTNLLIAILGTGLTLWWASKRFPLEVDQTEFAGPQSSSA